MKASFGFRGLIASVAVLTACAAPSERVGAPRSTLVVGIDASGSFRGHYEDAIQFAAHYLYGHLNGLGELRVPSAVFVGSVGGTQPGEIKSFQPIHAFAGKDVEAIAAQLRGLFPPEDSFTDFGAFFERVATLVKRQNLVLAPLDLVILTDGVPDTRQPVRSDTTMARYAAITLNPLEYLSRSVTVRLLYPSPTVAVAWERQVERRRVRMWTVDNEVMVGWRDQVLSGVGLEAQDHLWRWVSDNVDFPVRTRVL